MRSKICLEMCAFMTFGLRTWFESEPSPCDYWKIIVDYAMF